MIPISAVLMASVSHFMGDFVFQSDKIAKAKATSVEALETHVLIYGAALLVGMFPVLGPAAIPYAGINMSLHWFTDRVTAPANAKHWAAGEHHEFFVGLGLDQLIHIVLLVLTLKIFL